MRSVRKAASSSPDPSRHSFAPYASPTAIRTTEIGACTPPNGTTPGIRLPVRTITRPPISSRRSRFGEPTSFAPSGVIVAAFRPSPDSRSSAAASWTTAFCVARRDSSDRSKRGKSSWIPITSGASTRSDSSSSSWPVWSPSSTTIRFASMAPECSDAITGRPARALRALMARKGGWTRAGSRRHFRYLDARGRRITDAAKLERIEALVIPPAWKDVWISPRPTAKLQATGVDAAGRRQYLYHEDYRAAQEEAKFHKLVRFADALPAFREAMSKHMELEPMSPEWTCAVAVRLINLGWFRVGDDRYTKAHKTFGITTLRKGHVRVRGSRIAFRFRGKHRVWVRTAVVDSELAGAMRT